MTSCSSADGNRSNKSTADVDVCSGDTEGSNNPLSLAWSEVKEMHSIVAVGMQMMRVMVGGVVSVAPYHLGFTIFDKIVENGNYFLLYKKEMTFY